MHEALYNSGPSGFFAFTDSGTLVMLNETAATSLKYRQSNLQGHHVEKIFTVPTKIFYQTHFFPLVKMQNHADEIFVTLLCADGEQLPVLLNAKRMEWEGKTVNCCAFIVVRHRKKFEDELVAARNAAEKALSENTDLLKMKAELQQYTAELEKQVQRVNRQNHELQQFNHVITHSLKEPLRKLLLFSSMVEHHYSELGVSKMTNSAHTLNHVISSLQQYVWLNEKNTNFSDVDLNQVVSAAANKLKEESGKDEINLKVGDLATVSGDADQLQLMIYHFLSNAIAFRKNERVNVEISTVLVKQNRFRNVEGRYDYRDYVKLDVTDDGIGFENHFNELIFELFQKLHNNSGQGLGLALCKRIVENHNGFIEADSKIGEYTRITVWLPLAYDSAN
jgi:phosphoserine phosphatase RsbU/P